MDIEKEFKEKFCYEMMNFDHTNRHHYIIPDVIEKPELIIDWIKQQVKVEPEVKVNFAEEMYKAIKFVLDYDKREIRENDDYEVSFLYPANNLSYQKLLKAVKMYEDSKISA